jgi:hypothetical protein
MRAIRQLTTNEWLYRRVQWRVPVSNIEGREVAALRVAVEESRSARDVRTARGTRS